MEYIELSDGRVGYIENPNHPKFIEDLKRNGLSYKTTTENHYANYMIMTKLSPEQIYRQVGGKKSFGNCY
jgi:hypothetical protein